MGIQKASIVSETIAIGDFLSHQFEGSEPAWNNFVSIDPFDLQVAVILLFPLGGEKLDVFCSVLTCEAAFDVLIIRETFKNRCETDHMSVFFHWTTILQGKNENGRQNGSFTFSSFDERGPTRETSDGLK
jgi:hypothetical protein